MNHTSSHTQAVPAWHCGSYRLSFTLPAIMAIINVSTDSFSGDGLNGSVEAALRRAEHALAEGPPCLM